MLEQLQVILDKTVYKELRNSFYANHLNGIDVLVRQIQRDYPDFVPDNLVTKLTEIAERAAEEEVALILKYRKELTISTQEEINSYKQVKVAA